MTMADELRMIAGYVQDMFFIERDNGTLDAEGNKAMAYGLAQGRLLLAADEWEQGQKPKQICPCGNPDCTVRWQD